MSFLDELEAPWGQLVGLEQRDGEEGDVIPIVGDIFTIGRGKGEPKRVSQYFC